MKSLQKVPESLQDLASSYDHLYQGWMGEHKNIGQAQRIFELLDIQPGKRLLDIACGLGYLADMAAERGLESSGIDVSEVALRKAQQECQHGVTLLKGDAERLPWPSHTFDYVINLGSLEHFISPARAIQEMVRVLKPTGRAALLLPNSHHIRALYYVLKYGEVYPDLQDFERFATRKEWERLLTENGLAVVSSHKYDTGMARMHRKGNEVFWYLYNIMFRLLGNWWIPFNYTYTFIFICEPGSTA